MITKLCVILAISVSPSYGQQLNVFPDILSLYMNSVDQYHTFNLMANISEKLHHLGKFIADFEPTVIHNEYDFIIVGSGPAGCVLANRLSENPEWKILLLEAGKPESLPNSIPLAAPYLASTIYDWDYYAERYEGACLGIENQRCVNTRGRGLGGSSLINYMIFTRGNKNDFDEWAAMGNEGWSYEDVLPYFKKFERVNIGDNFDPKFRGDSGELNVEYPRNINGLANILLLAAQEAGHKLVDYNGETHLGASIMQTSTKNGRRHSAAKAFIEPIYKKRKNLHILTSALVTKILIDEETKTALGVQFQRGENTFTIYAKKEVILSAGTFKSPQLLMLSGIGPADHLESKDIEVIKSLPVGNEMYDHMVMPMPSFIVNTTGLSLNLKKVGLLEVLQFIKGRGVLTSAAGFDAVIYGKWDKSGLAEDQPDYELIFIGGTIASDIATGLRKEYHFGRHIYNTVFKPLENPEIDSFSLMVQQMRPKSSGTVRLRDKNPFSAPILTSEFFKESDDVEVILAGIREAIRISKTNVMQSIGATLHSIPIPGCDHHDFNSDDYWRCGIRTIGVSVHHQVSSNRMGPEDDGKSVVDPRLRVHGIKRLRVGDNSVLPTAVCAHTNAVSFMVGEKLADMLKEDWD